MRKFGLSVAILFTTVGFVNCGGAPEQVNCAENSSGFQPSLKPGTSFHSGQPAMFYLADPASVPLELTGLEVRDDYQFSTSPDRSLLEVDSTTFKVSIATLDWPGGGSEGGEPPTPTEQEGCELNSWGNQGSDGTGTWGSTDPNRGGGGGDGTGNPPTTPGGGTPIEVNMSSYTRSATGELTSTPPRPNGTVLSISQASSACTVPGQVGFVEEMGRSFSSACYGSLDSLTNPVSIRTEIPFVYVRHVCNGAGWQRDASSFSLSRLQQVKPHSQCLCLNYPSEDPLERYVRLPEGQSRTFTMSQVTRVVNNQNCTYNRSQVVRCVYPSAWRAETISESLAYCEERGSGSQR